MRFQALATDYDGTIAFEGQVDAATVAALIRIRDRGVRLVMVTGRELTELFNTFTRVDLFDRIVAENGAILYDPETKAIECLSSPPPPALVERLTREQVPMSVGHSVIATVEPHEHAVLAAIRDLGVEWHVIFNKGSVMALPSNVTKLTGLGPALVSLGVSLEQTVGVGDAENDQVFLGACGLAVAVGNALPAVKAMADIVMVQPRGAGVAELIARWEAGDLDGIEARARS